VSFVYGKQKFFVYKFLYGNLIYVSGDINTVKEFLMKRALFFLLLILVFSSLCFAQNANTRQRIVGLWIDNKDELWIFGSDGKLLQDDEQLRYSITDTQLSVLRGRDNIVFNFSMSSDGKTLLLNNIWYGSRTLTKTYDTPVSLTEGRWINGYITSNSMAMAYSFNAVSGRTYFIWANDEYEGDGSKSLDIFFVAFDESDVYNYEEGDDCWTDPCEITVSRNSRVIIVVKALDEDEIGTFAIAYSTNPRRP